MKEKESIKVSLGTAICVFIIFFLVIGMIVMYYFGFVKNNEKISELEDKTIALERDKNQLESQVSNLQAKDTKTESAINNQANQTEANTSSSLNNAKKQITYKDIAGAYSARIELNDEFEKSASYSLILLDNGKYHYEYGTFAPTGIIGNYIINDNEILLNKWFATGSDVRAVFTDGTIKLILNEDGTITDTNDVLKLNKANSSKIILKKDTSAFNQDDYEKYIKNSLNGEGLMNDYGNVSNGKWPEGWNGL